MVTHFLSFHEDNCRYLNYTFLETICYKLILWSNIDREMKAMQFITFLGIIFISECVSDPDPGECI